MGGIRSNTHHIVGQSTYAAPANTLAAQRSGGRRRRCAQRGTRTANAQTTRLLSLSRSRRTPFIPSFRACHTCTPARIPLSSSGTSSRLLSRSPSFSTSHAHTFVLWIRGSTLHLSWFLYAPFPSSLPPNPTPRGAVSRGPVRPLPRF